MFFTAGKTTPNPIPWIPTASHCTLTLGINISFEKLNTVFSWMHIHNEHPDFPNGLNSAWSLAATKTSRIWNTLCSHCHNPSKDPNQQTPRLSLTTRLFCFVLLCYAQPDIPSVFLNTRPINPTRLSFQSRLFLLFLCLFPSFLNVITDIRIHSSVSFLTLASKFRCNRTKLASLSFCPSSLYRFKTTKKQKGTDERT